MSYWSCFLLQSRCIWLKDTRKKPGGRAPVSKPNNLVFHRFGIAINAFKTSIITSWCFQPISKIFCQVGSSPEINRGEKKQQQSPKIHQQNKPSIAKGHQIFPARDVLSLAVRLHPFLLGGDWSRAARQGFTRRSADGHHDWDEKHEENCERRGKEPWPSKQQTVGWHGDLMLIYVYTVYIYIYKDIHIHKYHTKSRSKDYIMCLLWYGLYGNT